MFDSNLVIFFCSLQHHCPVQARRKIYSVNTVALTVRDTHVVEMCVKVVSNPLNSRGNTIFAYSFFIQLLFLLHQDTFGNVVPCLLVLRAVLHFPSMGGDCWNLDGDNMYHVHEVLHRRTSNLWLELQMHWRKCEYWQNFSWSHIWA